jgi:hypothetical protein
VAWVLTDNTPALYSQPDRVFRFIPTDTRPRSSYELMPGKTMVLLRDGLSDLVDLVTCLCLYAVEARKIRKRMEEPEYLLEPTLEGLPFTAEERAGITALWPQDTRARLQEVALHHEDFSLHVQKQRTNYNTDNAEEWSGQIAAAAEQLMGYEPAALPSDVSVHIISSNTHSVANCLSPFLARESASVVAWAASTGHRLAGATWACAADQVYALARDYALDHPEWELRHRDEERATGTVRLERTAFTGIRVQLIDVSRLATLDIDPGITRPAAQRPLLLINIDFAFGQQAEEILGNLLSLFGRNVASVNILGKAGALIGARGDVIVPTAFVEQGTDAIEPVAGPELVSVDALQRALQGRGIHVGAMLTVGGTLLQNRVMLNFYRHAWRCIGLEMEGFYYHRRLLESMRRGVVSDEVVARYLYYVSDVPLDPAASLSGRLDELEGVPPLYAVTREILNQIFR